MSARRAFFAVVVLMESLCNCAWRVWSDNITVDMNFHALAPAILAVDRGDTVTWQNDWTGTNAVFSYSGSWSSGALTNLGASFSVVFCAPGYFPYGTGISGNGVVNVLDWTNVLPSVTINTPVEGFRYQEVTRIKIGASVRVAATNLDHVDFFANTNLIGSAVNAPFGVVWTNSDLSPLAAGHYVVSAIVRDKLGNTFLSRPVNIEIFGIPNSSSGQLSVPHLLANGTFACYYSTGFTLAAYIGYYEQLPLTNNVGYSDDLLGEGVFVDPTAFNQRNGVRLYWLHLGQGPPP